MGVLDRLRPRRGNDVAVLTPLGKSKLEKPGVPEYQWRILNHLNENGPSGIHDISTETGISEEKVRGLCRSLDRDGFIRKAGGESE